MLFSCSPWTVKYVQQSAVRDTVKRWWSVLSCCERAALSSGVPIKRLSVLLWVTVVLRRKWRPFVSASSLRFSPTLNAENTLGVSLMSCPIIDTRSLMTWRGVHGSSYRQTLWKNKQATFFIIILSFDILMNVGSTASYVSILMNYITLSKLRIKKVKH